METTRRDAMGLMGAAAAAATMGGPAMAQGARNLGSKTKTLVWVASCTACDKNLNPAAASSYCNTELPACLPVCDALNWPVATLTSANICRHAPVLIRLRNISNICTMWLANGYMTAMP